MNHMQPCQSDSAELTKVPKPSLANLACFRAAIINGLRNSFNLICTCIAMPSDHLQGPLCTAAAALCPAQSQYRNCRIS